MKRNHKITALLLCSLLAAAGAYSEKKPNQSLDGLWYFKGQSVNKSPFLTNTTLGIYKSILNGKYITFITRYGGATVTGQGNLEIQSDSVLIEKVQGCSNTSMNDKENRLVYQVKDNKYLYVKFYVKKNNLNQEINSWYEELWEKQEMPVPATNKSRAISAP